MRQYRKLGVIFLLVAGLMACSPVNKYVLPSHQFIGAVVVSADVNPNYAGRASPITLYFFQLQGADTFNSADFFTLFNNPQKALGKDYVDMGKVDLAPGSQTEIDFPLDDKTKYIGILAGYQQLDQSVWRAVVPMNSWGKERVYVWVKKLTLSASKLDGSDASSGGIDLGSLASKAKSAATSAKSASASASGGSDATSGGSSSGSSSWASNLANNLSSSSTSSGSTSGGSSSSSDSSSTNSNTSSSDSSSNNSASSNSSGGGYMQKYNEIQSALKGGNS